MAGCACSEDSCKCVELERKIEELEETVGAYQIALEKIAEMRGKPMGLYYGSDGLQSFRAVAREALRA